MLSLGLEYRPKSHHHLLTFFEFTNWALFFAVWIALSVNIGQKDFCVNVDGTHSRSRECDTIYTALAFSIIEWLLFSVTFFGVGYGISKYRGTAAVHEKNSAVGGAARTSDATAV
jgi:hypothetical protein